MTDARRPLPDRLAAAGVLPVLLFTLYPVADALYTSLHQVIVIFPAQPFVGLENYRQVVTGPDFCEAFATPSPSPRSRRR